MASWGAAGAMGWGWDAAGSAPEAAPVPGAGLPPSGLPWQQGGILLYQLPPRQTLEDTGETLMAADPKTPPETVADSSRVVLPQRCS